MSKLPPISEYSFEGIWSTVRADVEEDINAIAEIWGQHRLVLADQHESHLPPQGEIRAPITGLGAVAEASASTERLGGSAEDMNVMIADLDASLVDGSNTGSAAYGLLERLQAMPRTRRMQSDVPSQSPPSAGPSNFRAQPVRNNSSPGILSDIPVITTIEVTSMHESPSSPDTDARRSSKNLLQTEPSINVTDIGPPSRLTGAVVSEVYLSAGADGKVVSDPPVVSEAGRHYPLYGYDESEVFESNYPGSMGQRNLSFRDRMQRLVILKDFGAAIGWGARLVATTTGSHSSKRDGSGAEDHLRGILGRHERPNPAASTQADGPVSQTRAGGNE